MCGPVTSRDQAVRSAPRRIIVARALPPVNIRQLAPDPRAGCCVWGMRSDGSEPHLHPSRGRTPHQPPSPNRLWIKCRPDRTRRTRVRSARENRRFSKWKKVMDDFFHGQLRVSSRPRHRIQALGFSPSHTRNTVQLNQGSTPASLIPPSSLLPPRPSRRESETRASTPGCRRRVRRVRS